MKIFISADMDGCAGVAVPRQCDMDNPDYELARHHIDLLAMLQEKTKGNLTLEEQRALDNSVTELRFRFVQAQGPA